MFSKIRYEFFIFCLLFLFSSAHASVLQPTCRPMSESLTKNGLAPVCDVTFTGTVPTFACGVAPPQVGVYTIINNTPVTMQINYIRVQVNDAFPAGDAAITATTCGASLASGATCTVTVTMTSAGPFNRVLQIGIDSRQVQLESPLITPTVNCNVPVVPSGSFPCALNSTSTFGTLAGSAITNTGNTIINGNLGLTPGSSVTGFPPGVVNGTTNINNATAITAKIDLVTLYTCLAAQPCGTLIGTGDQAGVTLTSAGVGAVNVYCSASSILDSGVLTLSGDATSVFIFQAGSTLTMGVGSSIVLTGGLTSANVFWQVGSSSTLNSAVAFQGTIAALQSNSLGTGATVSGRVLAINAAVTFISNSVTLP